MEGGVFYQWLKTNHPMKGIWVTGLGNLLRLGITYCVGSRTHPKMRSSRVTTKIMNHFWKGSGILNKRLDNLWLECWARGVDFVVRKWLSEVTCRHPDQSLKFVRETGIPPTNIASSMIHRPKKICTYDH